MRTPPPNRKINYAITKEHYGKGYAMKAVLGLTRYLFTDSNVDHLIIIALIENIVSNRVIQKSGYHFIKNLVIDNQKFHYYELNKNDWAHMR